MNEEVTNSGALHAVIAIPSEEVIALEVGPVAAEYHTVLSDRPIVLHGDMKGFYTKALSDRLKKAAESEGIIPQLALFENYASDGSAVLAAGGAGRATALCIPTQDTRGVEIIHERAVITAVKVLVRYLRDSM